MGSKKIGADGEAVADDDGGEGAKTLEEAAKQIQELKVQPREALAIMYAQGQLTAKQYEEVLAAIFANEVEQDEAKKVKEENEDKVVPPTTADDLVDAIKVLTKELPKGPISTDDLVNKAQEVIKRRTRSCGICKAPGVDRRSHKLGHKNAHLHVFTEVAPPSPTPAPPMPASPKTPAAPIAKTSSSDSTGGSEGKQSTCSKCGAVGVNAATHVLGHARAHLHDFSKDSGAKK